MCTFLKWHNFFRFKKSKIESANRSLVTFVPVKLTQRWCWVNVRSLLIALEHTMIMHVSVLHAKLRGSNNGKTCKRQHLIKTHNNSRTKNVLFSIQTLIQDTCRPPKSPGPAHLCQKHNYSNKQGSLYDRPGLQPPPHYHHTLHWSSHLNWVWHLLSFPLPNLKIYSRLRTLKRIGGPSYGNQLCSPLTGAWMAHVHQIYENPPIRPRYQCHLKTVVEHKYIISDMFVVL